MKAYIKQQIRSARHLLCLILMGILLPMGSAFAQNILLVIYNNSSYPEDQALVNHFQSQGYTVTTHGDDPISENDVLAYDLVFISPKARSWKILDNLKHAPVPIVVNNHDLLEDMEMALVHDEQSTQNAGDILLPTHPMAAGLTGSPVLVSTNSKFTWGTPTNDADLVVSKTGDPSKGYVFLYETGDNMFNSFIAPACRIGFFLAYNMAENLTADGWALVDAVVEHCLTTEPTNFLCNYGEDVHGEYVVTQLANGNYFLLGAGMIGGSNPATAGNVHGIELDPDGNIISDFVIDIPNIHLNSSSYFRRVYGELSNGNLAYVVEGEYDDGQGGTQICASAIFRVNPATQSLVYSKAHYVKYCTPVETGTLTPDDGMVYVTAGTFAVKVDANGNDVFSRSISSNNFRPRDVISFPNNELMVLGEYFYTANSPNNNTKILTIHLDANGDDINAFELEQTTGELFYPQQLATQNDGTVLISGKVVVNGEEKLMLVKMKTADGTIEAQRYLDLGMSGSIEVNEITPIANGGYLIGGGTTKLTGGGDWVPFLAEVSSDAHLQWFRHYDPGFGSGLMIYNIEPTHYGGYVMGLGRYAQMGADLPGVVLKTDAQGNITNELACKVASIGVNAFTDINLGLTSGTFLWGINNYNGPYTLLGSVSGNAPTVTAGNWSRVCATSCVNSVSDCTHDPLILAQPSTGHNRIISRTFRTPVSDAGEILNNSQDFAARDMHEEIAYFDGLGRPMQAISVTAAPDMTDVVGFNVYDAFGRESKQFLPFNDGGTAGSLRSDGANDLIPDALQAAFYQNLYPNQPAFGEIAFEPSPLNRVVEQGAPGAPWQLGQHTPTTAYLLNAANEVFNFGLNPTIPASPSYYAANELFKNEATDENGAKTIAFTDKLGRTICNWVQLDDVPTYAITYYIYDVFGNVKHVLPPEAVAVVIANNDQLNQNILDDWCFSYTYDARQRVIEKKIPAKEKDLIVYDKLDRVVATQDGNLRNTDSWLITKYDALNRPVLTGKADGITESAMRAGVDGNTILNESFDGTSYSQNVYPALNDIHSITYFDDYDFPDAPLMQAEPEISGLSSLQNKRTRGIVTGIKVAILNPEPDMPADLLTTTFYDEYGREIQTQAETHLHHTDVSSYGLNFAGELLISITSHVGPDGPVREVKEFCYDHRGRLIRTTSDINNQGEIVLAALEYNELSQLNRKKLYSTDNQQSYLQSIDHTFNIRGWLTGINDPSTVQANDPADLFRMNLFYDQSFDNSILTQELYNGNISAMTWHNGEPDDEESSYRFHYDRMNRILAADFAVNDGSGNWTQSLDHFSVKEIIYDLNGNIEQLKRHGKSTAGTFGQMDILSYNYLDASTNRRTNRLLSVSDTGNDGSADFMDGTNTGDDYSHDASGNVTKDENKGIINVIYNHLNKPYFINFGVDQNIFYIYDATGTKLRQVVNSPGENQGQVITEKRDYASGFQYVDQNLEFFAHEEGRVVPTGNSFAYEFNITDHLGNVRTSFRDNGGGAEVLHRSDYYPFGMQHATDNALVNTPPNRHLYNGKELHGELGLGWYDYGFRWSDQTIARFVSVDPLAEEYTYYTPFQYAGNKPVWATDLDGLEENPTTKTDLGNIDNSSFIDNYLRKRVDAYGLNLELSVGPTFGKTYTLNGRIGVSLLVFTRGPYKDRIIPYWYVGGRHKLGINIPEPKALMNLSPKQILPSFKLKDWNDWVGISGSTFIAFFKDIPDEDLTPDIWLGGFKESTMDVSIAWRYGLNFGISKFSSTDDHLDFSPEPGPSKLRSSGVVTGVELSVSPVFKGGPGFNHGFMSNSYYYPLYSKDNKYYNTPTNKLSPGERKSANIQAKALFLTNVQYFWPLISIYGN